MTWPRAASELQGFCWGPSRISALGTVCSSTQRAAPGPGCLPAGRGLWIDEQAHGGGGFLAAACRALHPGAVQSVELAANRAPFGGNHLPFLGTPVDHVGADAQGGMASISLWRPFQG